MLSTPNDRRGVALQGTVLKQEPHTTRAYDLPSSART